ncbi:MAG: Response regulators consisting of a CheY-like receiver domain and a winged-helix DNA-binding domain [Phormidium sp. OSCR]|nr:MAG: Response regulators consisting of a CheY-like receiver domain and a winged-helix DNA-binding domain [Phormidium sp. OSCR]
MRILLVEDDFEQREPIQFILKQNGHIVDAVEDGTTAQWLIEETDYDLLILDWMLPGQDGIDICKYYRKLGKTSPVLILTAKDTTADKVMGLDGGADDYLVKPIDLEELLARVRALRRRSPLWSGDRLEVSGLSLSLETMTLTWQNQDLTLKTRDFQLLEYLMRHPQQVLSHQQIEQALWEWGEEPESNAVVSRIKRLRQTLRELAIDSWIQTIYGMGYRFEPPQDTQP